MAACVPALLSQWNKYQIMYSTGSGSVFPFYALLVRLWSIILLPETDVILLLFDAEMRRNGNESTRASGVKYVKLFP